MEKFYMVSENKTWNWLAQIMSSLLQKSGLNWGKQGKPGGHSGWPKSDPSWLYSGSDEWIRLGMKIRLDEGI